MLQEFQFFQDVLYKKLKLLPGFFKYYSSCLIGYRLLFQVIFCSWGSQLFAQSDLMSIPVMLQKLEISQKPRSRFNPIQGASYRKDRSDTDTVKDRSADPGDNQVLSHNQFIFSNRSYIEISHIAGQGPGIDKGYSISKYMLYLPSRSLLVFPFFESDLLVSNSGCPSLSVGAGSRFQIPDYLLTCGANVFYDFRFFENRAYNQFGLGLEIFDFIGFYAALNGYFPLTKKAVVVKCLFDDYLDGYFVKREKVYVPQKCFSMLIGKTSVFFDNIMGSFAIEGYYLSNVGHSCRNFFGKKVSASFLFRVFKAEISLSHDRAFKTNFQGRVGILFPIGKQSWKNYQTLNPFVRRNENILIRKGCIWSCNY